MEVCLWDERYSMRKYRISDECTDKICVMAVNSATDSTRRTWCRGGGKAT